MAENRAPKRLKHCDTGEKATLKRSRTEDEEEEAPATKIQQRVPAGPDLEEDSGSSNSNQFDVFISHRGPDTKRTLAIHMYDLLQEKGIQAFLDKEELQSGETVWNAIKEAIAFSKVDVCILSSGYAESPWCLDELKMMVDKYNLDKSKLIPVFYDVEPADVRHLKGAFGQGFKKLIDKGRYSNEVIQKWQQALSRTADIKGHEGQGELCSKIVHEVREKLDFALVAAPGMVGRERELLRAINEIMRLREEGLGITSVEISGMGGIGKTTFAKNLYSRICSKFHKYCFIENVKGLVEKGGIYAVHKQLLNELFRCPDEWKAEQYLAKHLHDMEILVVLDNISRENLSSTVFIEHDVCLRIKSTIVVTTREEGILEQEPKFAKYPQNLLSLRMSKLDFETSKQIFCEYALGGLKRETSEWNDLINSFVKKCDGIPLALAVYGREVYGRDIQHWKIVWDKIKDFLHHDLMQKLKFSYDNLNSEILKRLFLDVATFLRFEKADLPVQLQERYGAKESEVLIALDVLKRKHLIQVKYGFLYMHDLLVDLGRSIVKEEDLCPGRRSRLWHPDEVKNVLSEETGTKKVTALSLVSNGSAILDDCGDPWSAEAFGKLSSLEFLILDGPCIEGNDFSKFSKKLLCLKWTNFPYDHIPETLCIKRLRVLHLSSERLTWLWERSQQETPAKLRELMLSYCKNLKRLPEFNERFLHLSCLKLEECRSLVTLPNSFGRLQGLKHLQLSGCNVLERLPDAFGDLRNLCKLEMGSLERLKSLPESFGNLLQLERLDIDKCNALQCLSESFGNLSQLKSLNIFECNALQCLPESFGNLSQLKWLDIDRCNALQCLAESFGNLSQLKCLTMSDCGALQQLPKSFENLSRLESWDMSDCWALQSLPASFDRLLQLKTMVIHLCEELRRLPESFGNLEQLQHLYCSNDSGTLSNDSGTLSLSNENLEIHWLGALQCLPESFGNLSQVNTLSIIGCIALQCLPESFGKLLRLEQLEIHECNALQRLPESFGNLSQVNKLSIIGCIALQCLPESFGNLSQLKSLTIQKCRALQCLPESFIHLQQLQKWSMADLFDITGLPETFGCLTNLLQLSIIRCTGMEGLPESFGYLPQLQLLKIKHCSGLKGLPESFGHLPQLQVLEIENCSGLEGLPKSFGCLTKLVELKVHRCHKIKLLAEQFQRLLGIPELSIMEIAYSSFGQNVAVEQQNIDCWKNSTWHGQDTQHQHLISLVHEVTRGTQAYSEHAAPPPFSNVEVIANHFLQELPQSLSASQHIKTLYLHHCHSLQKLPDIRGSLSSLTSLQLDSCLNLKVLPACIENLSRLKFLSLSSCWNLTEFPDTIGNLKNLNHLYVSDCIVLKGLAFQSGSFPNLVSFTVRHCWMVEVIDIHALVRLSHFEVDACVNLRSIAGLSGLPRLIEIEIQGCLNLKDIVPGDINGCASWTSLNSLEISGCYQLRPPCEGLVQQLPRKLACLQLSLSHDIISRASLDNQTENINWSLNAKVQGIVPSRVVNAKTNPALFPVVEQRVTHLLSTRHDSSSSSTSSFSFYKFSQLLACSSSSSTSSFFFHKFSQRGDSFSLFPLVNGNIEKGVGILCFVSVVGTVDSPMHVPPPQTVFSMKAQGGPSNIDLAHGGPSNIDLLVRSESFDFGEEIHMATFRLPLVFDLEHMYIEVRKGTDYWPSYEAIVKEGWIILLPGGQGEKGNEQNELLAAEILNIFYSELGKQRFMSRAWTQLPSQLHIFEFSALDIAGCQITKTSRHCNTCIMEEETGLTWERRRCLFVDDHALLLQHPRSSSRHSFLAYPGLHLNLEGGGVLANLYEMSICMFVKGKVVHSIKLQEMVGINQVEIPGDLNTLLQRKASLSTLETLHRKRSEMLRGEAYTCFKLLNY